MPIQTKAQKKKKTGNENTSFDPKPQVNVTSRRDLTPEEKIELAKKAASGPGGQDAAIRAGLAQTIQNAQQEQVLIEQQKQLTQQKGETGQAIQGLGEKVKPTVSFESGGAAEVGLSAASIIGGAAGGAATLGGIGAAAGSVVPGLGTAAGGLGGAVVGGVIGGIGALSAKISLDRRQVTKEAKTALVNVQSNEADLLRMAADPTVPAAEVVYQYNRNLANLIAARDELEKQTDGKINSALSNARDELIEAEEYLELESRRRQDLEAALRNRVLTTQAVGAFTPPSQVEFGAEQNL